MAKTMRDSWLNLHDFLDLHDLDGDLRAWDGAQSYTDDGLSVVPDEAVFDDIEY